MVIPDSLKSDYPFQTFSFNVQPNIQMNYINEGSGDPIVMLHGNPSWSFYFRNIVKELSLKYQVIVPDHIGCGLSSKPQEYSYCLETHIQNIEKLIKHLNLKNITLIVHDWGGAIGFGYATRHSQNIKNIVITNTAAFLSKDIPWQIALCKMPFLGKYFIRSLNLFAWPATFMTTIKKLSPREKSAYLFPYNNFSNRIAIDQFVQDIPMNKKHPTYDLLKKIETDLPKLKCPKLILWGEKDFCFNYKFLNRWQEIYPRTKTITMNAGHYLFEDSPKECLKHINQFI